MKTIKSITLRERLAKVEVLLDHIIKNDLMHIRRLLYALIVGLVVYGVCDRVF